MTDVPIMDQSTARRQMTSIFTIIGGTTVPDRAEIVRSHCREGSTVELRREEDDADGRATIGVWLLCPSFLGLMSIRKKIGFVPVETAEALEPLMDESSTVVARATVRSVYAPIDRDEAVVTVEIMP
ncbi:HIRAN domain-containing protein [Polaromonas sp.]|uniref:HIRAN domain-containing protein n=1 Tax=Polaromonas sp. TaxID=1869339 RepID=UPI00286CC6F1|nr:HIRAN domain-containing protein [Polaromonas sp.]